MRSVSVISTFALLTLAPVVRANPTPTGEKVRYGIKDVQTDFGRLHISANLLGYELSGDYDGLVTNLHGLFELGGALMVRAYTVFPFLGGVGSAKGPVRLEVGIGLHGTSIDVEIESVTLSQERIGDQIHTKSLPVPVLNRNSRGLGAGLMYRDNAVEVDVEERGRDTRGRFLTAYVGFSAINSAGYDLDIEGYSGSFFNYRWMSGGIDFLVDVIQEFGIEPSESANRFGGRLWTESIFGSVGGLSGRLEIGYMPGDTGFYFMAAIGGGIHLL